MSSFNPKVYIVQKFHRDGTPGEVIAVKLVFSIAHQIAKAHAPCKIVFGRADKTLELNVMDHFSDQPRLQSIANTAS